MDQTYVENETPYNERLVPGALTFSIAEGLTILSGILHKTGMALLGVDLEVRNPVFLLDEVEDVTLATADLGCHTEHYMDGRRSGQTSVPRTVVRKISVLG